MKVAQSCLPLCNPMDDTVHGILQAGILEWDSSCLLQEIFPTQGIEPRSPALQVDSLPSEPPGRYKNTGVGSLSLTQEIFQTQESNWDLLHCRWILYQLSYQGSPIIFIHRSFLFWLLYLKTSTTQLSHCSSGVLLFCRVSLLFILKNIWGYFCTRFPR